MAKPAPIPFNKPFIVGKELYYIAQAVQNGHLAGNGAFAKSCERWIQERTGCERALLTHSCTGALEIAAILLDLQPGDEVILPSYTFVTTANAFVLRGAKPVFCDILPETLNLNPDDIEARITEKTKAIIAVHYAGVACKMDQLRSLADRHQLILIEDAAQAVDAHYHGRALGSIGHLATFSFHETKNFVSGEGGALLINDKRFIERAEIVWEKGTNRSKFLRGAVDKYTWVDIGSSYQPSELVAAFLFAQLEHADEITARRTSICGRYQERFAPLESFGKVRLPKSADDSATNGHMFYLILESEEARNALIDYLRKRQIGAVFHYVPLHTSPVGRSFGYTDGDLPVTEELAARLVRLPCYHDLTLADQDRVIGCVESFFGKAPDAHGTTV